MSGNNISGYGVNSNFPISNQNTQTPRLPENAVPGNTQKSFKNDGYSFDLSTLPTGKVPDVKVGFWDKVSGGFGDVMNTPQNLQAFKQFEGNVFLKAGAGDSNKVMDLQRKLKFLGYNVNINGNFGPATEKAVLQFKNNVAINDGFLNKDGKYAVTSMVANTTMNMINSKVASKLNNPGQVDVPNITKDQLDWAKSLRTKIIAGYKPSETERKQYESIYQKQQMSISAATGTYNAGTLPGPSPAEMQWAKDFITRVKQYGAKPTQEEVGKYNDIYRRQQMSKVAPQQTVQSQQPAQQQGGVSPAEMQWARSFAQLVKDGYKPKPEELDRYNKIFNAQKVTQNVPQQQVQQQAPVQQQSSPVSQAEFAWAKQFEEKVNAGQYKPTQQDLQMYTQIYNKMSGGNVSTPNIQQQQAAQPKTGPVSADEMKWAQNLEKALEGGHQMTAQEKSTYENIFSRWQNSGMQQDNGNQAVQPTQTNPQAAFVPPTQAEIDFALDLEKKVASGTYKAQPQELAKYKEVADKLNYMNSANLSAQNQTQPVQQNNTTAQPEQTRPRIQNNTGTQPFSYNDQSISQFTNAFQGVQMAGNSIPLLPTDVGTQIAQKYGFTSVEELQSSIGAKVDGKFGPETFFRLQNALTKTPAQNQEQAPVQASNQNVGVQQTQTQQGGATPEELAWATQFIQAVKGGYTPSDEQKALYTDIFNRNGGQASAPVQNQQTTQQAQDPFSGVSRISVNGSSTDPDMAWALQILEAVRTQGYTPSDEEAAKYEQVMARNVVSG